MAGSGQRTLDREALRARLAENLRALEEAGRPDPERARKVLEERARMLARPLAEERGGELLHLLVLRFSEERYALDTRSLLEVVREPAVTALPRAPAHVVGIAAYRGEALPVFDLPRLLGAPPVPGERGRLVVLGAERPEFGVLAGSDLDERRVEAASLVPASTALRLADTRHVRGVLPDATVVVDTASLLGDPRFFLEEASDAQPS